MATLLLTGAPVRAATPTATEFDDGTANQGTQYGITPSPNGTIWFTSYGAHDSLFEIDPMASSPVSIERPLEATSFQPWWVAPGVDGRLYFSTNASDSFGALNTATGTNDATFYGGGNPAKPFAFVSGPDGRLWATEPRDGSANGLGTNDKIGINAPGFPPSVDVGVGNLTGNADPLGIAVGAGDQSGVNGPSLWVTEFTGNRIARVVPMASAGGPFGSVTEYATLPAGSKPYSIVLGPDGNMWFTEIGTDKVGRFAPPVNSGDGISIQQFSLPAGGEPQAIAAGPDGNMWIAQTGASKIIRMNLSGQVTGEFTTPSPAPNNIVPGPDGNLWYTTYDGNMVGRITTALDPPAFRNTAQINVPASGDNGAANTYPSNVSVSGLQGNITKVTVRVTGISHTFPDDLDILLQGPQNQNVMLASDAGSPGGSTSYPANGITLTFDQSAARSLPDKDPLVSGIYKPTNNAPGTGATQELSGAAPPAPYGGSLSNFIGSDPNGTWKLFVLDDNTESAPNTNVGKIFGGWGLDISTSGQIFVGKSGSGSGTVTSVPAGIDCGGTCVSSFEAGSSVVLTATPSAGSKFAKWQGCDSVSGNQCTVNVNGAIENATASFDLIPGTVPPPGTSGPTPTTPTTTKKKCKKAKKRSALAAKKCKKRKK
jgi:streptogramin lyase